MTHFVQARLKVARARRHIAELHHVFASFVESGPCELSIELDAERGLYLLKVDTTKPLDQGIALALGDAVHNLRTALDYAISEIFRGLQPQEDDRQTRFPIAATKADLLKHPDAKRIKAVAPRIHDLIVDELRPLGNSGLYALQQLARADRHRLLTPVIGVTHITGLNATSENGNEVRGTDVTIEQGEVMTPIAWGDRAWITGYESAEYEMFFGRGDAFAGHPIVPVLCDLVNETQHVVVRLERCFFGGPVRTDDGEAAEGATMETDAVS